MRACYYYFLYLRERKRRRKRQILLGFLRAFINILRGQADKKHSERLQQPGTPGRVGVKGFGGVGWEGGGVRPSHPQPTASDWKINRALHTNGRTGWRAEWWLPAIISFHSSAFLRFIRQSAITIQPFPIPPERRETVYMSLDKKKKKVPHPACASLLMLSITF